MIPPQFEGLPLETLLRANSLCNRFEQALRAGQSPPLDDWLAELPEHDRPAVRAELEALAQAWRMEIEPPPREMGEYLLEAPIGQGGMGRVYRAVHRTMKRSVALKVLRGQDPTWDQRFQREIEILARLQHPNLVAAFDAGRCGTFRYLVTELVDGVDLDHHVGTRGPFPLAQALDVLRQTCQGLDYLHREGIIHRDLKPSNLMLDRTGRVRILDVGLARLLTSEDGSSITGLGQFLGTAAYAAPEQALNPKKADARSDLYALGCTLFFLLTGRPPFHGQSVVETLQAHRSDSIPPLPANVPVAVDRLYQRLLAKSPSQRPESAQAVLAELGNLTTPAPLRSARGAGSTVLTPAATRSPHRAPTAIWTGLVAGVALAGLVVALMLWRLLGNNGAVVLESYPLTDAAAYQQAWATKLKQPVAVTNDLGMKFLFIPPGKFWAGTPENELKELLAKVANNDERERIQAEEAREVTLARPFYLGATEVTIGQFRHYIRATQRQTHAERFGTGYGVVQGTWKVKPGFSWENLGEQPIDDELPVCNITWDEAAAFCTWLTSREKDGERYRLPTEVEWEYACRAGSQGPWCCGEVAFLGRHAWFADNTPPLLHPVGQKAPNAFGLYDLHGNHSEWCAADEERCPLPAHVKAQGHLPVRGGSFYQTAPELRCAARIWAHPSSMGMGGMRVVREITTGPAAAAGN
jgi:formylglycine-generating enzyme required for sulfatase activity